MCRLLFGAATLSLLTFAFLILPGCSNSVANDSPLDSTSTDDDTTLTGGESTLVEFVRSEQPLGETRTFGMTSADVDMDGDQDVFIANYIGLSTLWINDGSGGFTVSSEHFYATSVRAYEAHDASVADLNDDTYPDIFVLFHNAPSRVYLNDGTGDFSRTDQSIGGTDEAPQFIQLIDVDADGDLDAVIRNYQAASRIWLNDGAGQFTMDDVEYPGDTATEMHLADFNGDSLPDMFFCIRNEDCQIWMNDGNGRFVNSNQSLDGDANDVASGDVDGDGDTDLIVAEDARTVIWLNEANSGFFTQGPLLNGTVLRCALFDVESDGDLDIATTHQMDASRLWINDGAGSFSTADSLYGIFGQTGTLSVLCNDFNGDLKADVLTGMLEGNGGNRIFFNHSTTASE